MLKKTPVISPVKKDVITHPLGLYKPFISHTALEASPVETVTFIIALKEVTYALSNVKSGISV